MLPLARQSMTYGGKLYGLPYYTSYFGLIYNEAMLKAAGFSGPPKTYDEWSQQAREIKSKGLSKSPMIWPVKHTGWGGMWVLNAMAASRGGKVLDEQFGVTPVALDSLRWWAGTYKEGLSDPNGLDSTATRRLAPSRAGSTRPCSRRTSSRAASGPTTKRSPRWRAPRGSGHCRRRAARWASRGCTA